MYILIVLTYYYCILLYSINKFKLVKNHTKPNGCPARRTNFLIELIITDLFSQEIINYQKLTQFQKLKLYNDESARLNAN